jgi:hypothetical protein
MAWFAVDERAAAPNGGASKGYERTLALNQRTSWLVDLGLFNIVTPR